MEQVDVMEENTSVDSRRTEPLNMSEPQTELLKKYPDEEECMLDVWTQPTPSGQYTCRLISTLVG